MGKSKKSLIIVESPAKIKTLRKFLGSDYAFESSVGHVRDLPEKDFGIDIENDFEPTYVLMPDKKDVVAKLKKAAKECSTVYLCPDPDREGEAIAWHIKEILPEKTDIKRVSFNSITKEAVVKALAEPREIDNALVDAQQARRLLDRLVGYSISPILNRRIQRGRGRGVSAGRVQSAALKLVVDREREIEAFVAVEYWNLAALLKKEEEEKNFKASLYSVDGKRVEKEEVEGKDYFLINNKESADEVLNRMQEGSYSVKKVVKKEKRRYAVPPFITSTLQQEASRHLGYSSARTMNIAQKLYEGIDMGNEGAEGLITYMRTDSVRSAPEAISAARRFIQKTYGPKYLPESPKYYSSKKSAQDAHEAIRPTNLQHPPEKVRSHLTKEQFLLYQLIWQRFLASQMMPAVYDTVSADIENGKGIALRATGSVIKFDGFLAVYQEMGDDEEKKEEEGILPSLEENLPLLLIDVTADQAFTRPPPRYTEASLVKELEKSGIGRPSTYAAIMNKIQSRDYTTKVSGRLKPTELGTVIADLLEANFTKIMNIDFTANMENDLELVAENKKDWHEVLEEFWKGFSPTLETAKEEAFVPKVPTEHPCPKCKDGKLQKVWYRDKYFYGCTNYPDCDYSSAIEAHKFNKEDYAEDFDWEQNCPLCGEEMKLRHGKFGAFLGCSCYPDCKGIVNIPKKGEKYIPESEMPLCPAIGCDGKIMARKSRFGKTFYSCSTYPDCDVIANSLEELETKYQNYPRTPHVKKTRAKKGKGKGKGKTKKKSAPRKMPDVSLSKPLAELVGGDKMTRGEVTKKVWEYIKSRNLQDPKDKRQILPDKALAELFGSDESVSMFKMTALISKHIQSGGSS